MKPNKRTTVATLLATGTSQLEIARLTGVDRKTIRRLAGMTGPEPNSPTLAAGAGAANSSTLAIGSQAEEIPPPRPPASDTGPQSLCVWPSH